MCVKDDPVEYTWKCGHTAPHLLGSEIYWCAEALQRGRLCAIIQPSDKARTRDWAETTVCPTCRPRRASEGSVYEYHKDDHEKDDKGRPPKRRLGSVGPSGIITGV
ncbi:uncharacterized protein CIMG_07685 [Coccidioides immitis RS]|uniref:Uncharacterized protein n=4 Tax=Coccidioides TaxID=5500 RepID=J3K3X0_COCIM|nr:uncharacterized protein CIMG_07685 [Coccidioides immitis RS]EFW14047.1 conserved hypothetical protein [Coccidioides posadasii str. Silveira]KMP06065.1 hypothetical protein CIRG_05746 [Coccidioides immitis RMSCC 2394]KMU87741.1 hypothetical protein CIHG_05510 [Coccidioides immitis H538.4]TPX22886.1 hypothetical protein DIZ76_014766 [Coccidioides immitis]EAS28939.3 hypothetical protein CIMG_07685 [Coccidioides immitis RS]